VSLWALKKTPIQGLDCLGFLNFEIISNLHYQIAPLSHVVHSHYKHGIIFTQLHWNSILNSFQNNQTPFVPKDTNLLTILFVGIPPFNCKKWTKIHVRLSKLEPSTILSMVNKIRLFQNIFSFHYAFHPTSIVEWGHVL